MLPCDIRDYNIDTAVLVSTRYSAIFFLCHLDFGSKTFLYMFIGSATLPWSLVSCWTSIVRSLIALKRKWVQSIAVLLKAPSKVDLKNNLQKWFNANSRAVNGKIYTGIHAG